MYDAYARHTFATPPHHHFAHFMSLRFCSRTAILPPQLAVCELNSRVWTSLTRSRVARSNLHRLADFQDQSLTTPNKRPNCTACSIPKIRLGHTKTNVHTFNQCLWTTTNVSLIWAVEERKVDGFAHRVLPCRPVVVNQAVHLPSLPMSASRQELTVSSKSSSTKLEHEEY